MKRYLKFSLIVLTLSIMSSLVLTNAYASPGFTTYVQVTLPTATNTWDGSWRTKNTDITQQYAHEFSSTMLTKDCTDCMVSTDLYTEDGKISSAVTIKGNIADLRDSFNQGDYRVKLWRVNPGLLKTTHTGTWYINNPYSFYQ